MRAIFFLLGFFAPFGVFAGTLMLAIGGKGEPMNLALAGQGVLLMLLSLIAFPRPGHPMMRLFGAFFPKAAQAGSPKKTEMTAEQAQFLQDFVEYNTDVLTHDQGVQEYHSSPARLDPIVLPSDEPRTSWIGGTPSLPDEIDWPSSEAGAPMLFLAQIAAKDLPDGIWGGMAPKGGWLCLFVGSDDLRQACVLHTKDIGSKRPYPGPPTYYLGLGREKMLKHAKGSERPVPVEWPVRVRPAEGPDALPGTGFHQKLDKTNPRAAFATQATLDDPLYQPPDWRMVEILASCLLDRMELVNGYGTEDQKELFRQGNAKTLSILMSLAEIAEAKRGQAFSDVDKSDVVSKFRSLTLTRLDRKVDPAVLVSPAPLLEQRMSLGDYVEILEHHYRAEYSKNPTSIDAAFRARLEPVWLFDAQAEPGTMGGKVHEGFPYSAYENPVFLMELPTSDLVGWTWGDVTNLGLFISPENLQARKWDQAWGDILN